MNIKITDSWLRDYLVTPAMPKEISKYLSLCGPTVESTTKVGNDWVYDIEVTTNRADTMSVYGTARELKAILPRFGIKASLKKPIPKPDTEKQGGMPLTLISDPKLTKRLMGVVLTDIKNWNTPAWMRRRLELVGHRSLNAVVDITNYIMHDLGHPCHVFDYDKLRNPKSEYLNPKIVVRESRKGEKITSFDGKTYTLPGGDIVFDDGDGNIIDLPGIIGTKNSVVDKSTKSVLFFFDTCDPVRIRRTSMALAIRTAAATLNEKGVDPTIPEIAVKRGLRLFEKICGAKQASKIYDSYKLKQKPAEVKTTLAFLESVIGINLKKTDISKILESLGFKTKWSGKALSVVVPTFRTNDVTAPVDIAEEVARIHGYHNLPSRLMEGAIPWGSSHLEFKREQKIKTTLTRLYGTEVYTYSLVGKNMTGNESLRLKNPLGKDTEYLRDNLYTSLLGVANKNISISPKFHLFEIANTYHFQNEELPEERLTLAGIFAGFNSLEAKGVIETFLSNLNIDYKVQKSSDSKIIFKSGEVTALEMSFADLTYYESKLSNLFSLMRDYPAFTPIPLYPPQIEDITVKIGKDKLVGDVYSLIKSAHRYIQKVELKDQFKNSYTFRVYYQHPKKTLTNKEVEKIRKTVLRRLQ